jgi:hypothetical protein
MLFMLFLYNVHIWIKIKNDIKIKVSINGIVISQINYVLLKLAKDKKLCIKYGRVYYSIYICKGVQMKSLIIDFSPFQ